MTNPIFQSKQFHDLEDRAIAASLDGSPATTSAKKPKPDLLTAKTRRRIEAIDSALGGGWLETKLQDFLETVVAEDWTAEGAKPFMPGKVFYSQFVRLDCLRKAWIDEDNPKPAPRTATSEKGLTDGKSKRKRRPHPLFGDAPRKAA